jgi:hypothetical protein
MARFFKRIHTSASAKRVGQPRVYTKKKDVRRTGIGVRESSYSAAEPQPKGRLTTEATEFPEKSRSVLLCGLCALFGASFLRRAR